MREASAAVCLDANIPGDQAVARHGHRSSSTSSATKRSSAKLLMARIKARFSHKPSEELRQILGGDLRSAQRYFAGDRVPDGPVAFYMLTRPEIGIALVEEATRDLPPNEYREFWDEMGRAALRAQLRKDLRG